MADCTFFGHRDCPDSIRPLLVRQIEDLIENHDVTVFYVGNKGRFDTIVRSVLRELTIVYPGVYYGVIEPYHVKLKKWDASGDKLDEEGMIPEGLEEVHPRYAIEWINRWMLRQSDFVIAYVSHDGGGAAKFTAIARRQGKTVINLAEQAEAIRNK